MPGDKIFWLSRKLENKFEPTNACSRQKYENRYGTNLCDLTVIIWKMTSWSRPIKVNRLFRSPLAWCAWTVRDDYHDMTELTMVWTTETSSRQEKLFTLCLQLTACLRNPSSMMMSNAREHLMVHLCIVLQPRKWFTHKSYLKNSDTSTCGNTQPTEAHDVHVLVSTDHVILTMQGWKHFDDNHVVRRSFQLMSGPNHPLPVLGCHRRVPPA